MRQAALRGTLTAAVLILCSGGALSQDAPSGTVMELGVSTSLRAHDNIGLDAVSPGNTYRSVSRLSFGLTSETRSQRLALSFGGALQGEKSPGNSATATFEDPSVGVSYSRQGANAQFTFGLDYTRTEVDGFAPIFDSDLGTTQLISDDGHRNAYRISTALAIGTNSPFGVTLSLNSNGIDYSGTSDPELFDSHSNTLSLTTSLRFSEVTTGRVSGSFSLYRDEDTPRVERDTRALSFGVTHALSETMTLDASLGGRRIDSNTGGVSSSGEGSLSFTRELPNGAFNLSLDSLLTTAGRRDRVDVKRDFAFDTWSLGLSAGVVNAAGVAAAPVFDVTYARQFSRGELSASLSSGVSINEQAQVQRVISTELGYTHLIGEQSSVTFGIEYADIEDAGSTGVTARERGSLRASYRHALVQDWSVSVGAERRFLREAGSTATDNAVFLTIDKTFTFLP